MQRTTRLTRDDSDAAHFPMVIVLTSSSSSTAAHSEYTVPDRPVLDLRPVHRLERMRRCGVHVRSGRMGWPGPRFTERLDNYERLHFSTDDLAHVNFGNVTHAVRLDAAPSLSVTLSASTTDSIAVGRTARTLAGATRPAP